MFGLTEQSAQGTALVMVVPNVCLSVYRYFRRGSIDWRLAGVLAAAALPMTLVSARYATLLPSRPLQFSFAIFLLVLAVFSAWRLRAAPVVSRWRAPWPVAGLVGAVAGIVSGLFSIGGAIISVPIMSALFGLSQIEAQGLGLAFAAPATVLSIVVYAFASDVDWAIGIPLAIGGVATVSAGVDVAHRLPDRVLRALFIGFLVVVGIALIVKARG